MKRNSTVFFFVLLAVLMYSSISSAAPIDISGQVCDASWLTNHSAGTDFTITDDLYVCCGKTRIWSGVEITVEKDASDPIEVHVGYDSSYCTCTCGFLEGEGRLQFDNNITVSSDEGSPAAGDWGGIHFYDSTYENTVNGTTFRHGGNNNYMSNPAKSTLYIYGDNTEITNSVVRDSMFNGVYFDGGVTQNTDQLKDSEIYDCGSTTGNGDVGYGVKIGYGAVVEINGTCIHDNLVGGIGTGGATLYLYDSHVEDNEGVGILSGSWDDVTIEDTFINGNGETGQLHGFVTYHAGIIITGSDVDFSITDSCLYGNQLGDDDNYEMVNLSDEAISAENVFWDSTSSATIDSYIYDDNENVNSGAVDFTPYDTSCSLSSCQ